MTKILIIIAITLGTALMCWLIGILPTLAILLGMSVFALLAAIVMCGMNQLWNLMLLSIIGLELTILAISVIVITFKS